MIVIDGDKKIGPAVEGTACAERADGCAWVVGSVTGKHGPRLPLAWLESHACWLLHQRDPPCQTWRLPHLHTFVGRQPPQGRSLRPLWTTPACFDKHRFLSGHVFSSGRMCAACTVAWCVKHPVVFFRMDTCVQCVHVLLVGLVEGASMGRTTLSSVESSHCVTYVQLFLRLLCRPAGRSNFYIIFSGIGFPIFV